MGQLAVMRDISLLWLILLGLLTILPISVLFFYTIKGLIRLRQLAKYYLPIAQEKTRFVADRTDYYSHRVAEPIISVQAKAAQADGIRKAILPREKST